jgi:hypothetical protein
MKRKWGNANFGKRVRRIVATTTALTFFCQNFAWAVCADGTTFPANSSGFVSGQPPTAIWSPNAGFLTITGSIFIPDSSAFEHNDPTQPSTGGGHNWVFNQQGSTLCKVTDIGPAGGTPTAWQIPPFNTEDCILLPVIKGIAGNPPAPIYGSITDVPYQGDVITPTCDPTQYVGGNPRVGPALPTNTYFNHLGCSISRGVATTPQIAASWLFVTGVNGGLFVAPLSNASAVPGGSAGKGTVPPASLYSNIPLGQKLTSATVSPDGQFAMATTFMGNSPTVFGCLNPLGDPTGTNPVTGVQSFPITGPINPNFVVPLANAITAVPCMQVGQNGLTVDETTIFGPDSQPYFGGNPAVNTFDMSPGGSFATAWPQCIFNGFGFPNPAPTTLAGKLAVVFNARSANPLRRRSD